MTKARDLANAGTALTSVSATELGYVDGVTSAIQTQIDSKEPTLPSQTGNSGKYLTTNGSTKSWGTVSQYSLPSQTGNSGKFLTTNGTSESWGTVNQNPVNWIARQGPITQNPAEIASNGTGTYVVVGNSGMIFSSTDSGVTWTERTSGFGANRITGVAFGNGLFVAVGHSGTLTTSSDGITWTARTSNVGANNLYDVTYANSLWVAVAEGGGVANTGGIIYSTDGITWTRKSQSLTVGDQYNTVIWNGTNWIVGANQSTNNYLYATTPSGTWTAANAAGLPVSNSINKLWWDGTRNIIGDGGGGLAYTTGTTLASPTAYRLAGFAASTSYAGAVQYNGVLYSVGNSSASGNGAIINRYYTASSANIRRDIFSLNPSIYVFTSGTTQVEQGIIFADANGFVFVSLSGIWTSF